MLEINNLTHIYANGHKALDNVRIQFPSGHIFAILGESGSGKTTLLRCLGRFIRPTKGNITIHGRPLREIPEKALRQKLGIVFQQLCLFPHMTVLQNMTLAPRKVLGMDADQAEEKAAGMLERLGISQTAEQYPAQISGGQAQRVAIARALMLEPEYLLLDEPTSALDVNITGEFAQWLLDLQGVTTFVVVTHDFPFASHVASSGVLLQEGKVTAEGDMNGILEQFQTHPFL
ncbi:amino acid ABC transporter ATP-binding protein [bacterium]|nr:amino acid ABC transporter ATP-binding protein [bacterium]